MGPRSGDSLLILLSDTRISLLFGRLLGAALIDMNSYRIPNLLVLAGAGIGILYNTAFAPSLGLASVAAGMTMGLALLLPFYLLRAMGAADVKLMAMTYASIGPWDTFFWVLHEQYKNMPITKSTAVNGAVRFERQPFFKLSAFVY